MANVERIRDFLSGAPAAEYFEQKLAQGWRLVSVDWERPVDKPKPVERESTEEVPFGLQIADDCEHLKENSNEKSALVFMMEMIVKDEPLTKISDELNRHGYRNRDDKVWTPGQVFDLLPRLVDVGPRIFNSSEYIARKQSHASA